MPETTTPASKATLKQHTDCKKMKKLFGLGGALALALVAYSAPVETRSIHGRGVTSSGTTSFNVLKLGNGGLVTQLDMKSDGTKAASGDSTGGWVWPSGGNAWVETLNTVSMPAGTYTQDFGSGADKIVIDPNTTTTLWMLFNGRIYKTVNSGTTWLDASSGYAPAQIRASSNTATSSLGQYAAVDPNNSNIVYFSSPNAGPHRTTNGLSSAASVTWSRLTTLGGGLPMRSNNLTAALVATTSISSVNLGTVNGTTITINKARFTSSGSFTTASPTITLTTAIPAWVSRLAYMDIWDVTTGTKIGLGCGYAGSVITLCANSAINSSGASDTLAISYPRLNANEPIQVWQTSAPNNQFYGTLVSDNSAAGTLTINVNFGVLGSGTATDWSVGYAGFEGYGGGHRFAFDTNGGTTASCAGRLGVCTKNVYLHTYGIGTYKSIDGGQSWSLMVEANAPDAVYHMTISPNGTLWVQNHMYPASTHNLQKFVPGSPGVWTEQVTGTSWMSSGVAVDPVNCATEATCHVAASANDGTIWYSANAGAGSPTWYQSGARTYSSTGDVSWVTPDLTALLNNFFAGTTLAYDPSASGTLYRGGEGVWKTTNPPTSSLAAITWTQQTRGIEMFVLNQVVSPVNASNSAVITTWDVPCFYVENISTTYNTYPTQSTCFNAGAHISLKKTYAIDWFPRTAGTPGVVTLVYNGDSSNDLKQDLSGISYDKGKPSPSTWTQLSGYTASGSFAAGATTINLTTTVPAGVTVGQYVFDNNLADWNGSYYNGYLGTVASKAGSTITLAAGAPYASRTASDNIVISPFNKTNGCIAASTNGTVLVRFNGNTGSNLPYISNDSGQTWAPITLPVAFTSGWGNGENYLTYTKFCDSDKTNGDIYIYSPWGVTALYRYNAATTAWTYQGAPNFSNGYLNGQMKTVYNKTGHLFFSSGQSGSNHGAGVNYMYFSNNYGGTWTVLPTFNEVSSYAIGKEAPGATYPTIYANGYRSGVPCIWRSTNWDPNNVAAATWTCIGYQPNGSASNVIDMDADKNIYGQFYGVNGKQAFVGVLN